MSQPPGPYGQPQDPYGQPPPQAPPPTQGWPSYGPPGSPAGPPTSGAPYPPPPPSGPGYGPPPTSGAGYTPPPTSGAGYGPPPTSGAGYAPPPTPGAGYGPPTGYQPAGYQPTGYLDPTMAGMPQQPPEKRRGLMITTIVLAVVLLLCGGGGTAAYFLVKKVDGKGQVSPVAAVDGFLNAVFRDQDAAHATRYVCSASRNKASLTKKINELKAYQDQYKSPHFSWPTPTVEKQDKTQATLTVPVKLSTSDDRVAEKKLKFLTVNEAGWWVCEVSDAG